MIAYRSEDKADSAIDCDTKKNFISIHEEKKILRWKKVYSVNDCTFISSNDNIHPNDKSSILSNDNIPCIAKAFSANDIIDNAMVNDKSKNN